MCSVTIAGGCTLHQLCCKKQVYPSPKERGQDLSRQWNRDVRRSLYWLLIVAFSGSSTGCSSLSYYQQAIAGQLSLLSNRRAVEDVLEDDSVPEEVQERLKLTQELRAFAESNIGLPVGDTFNSYVDTGKSYVVWNVFSAAEFSLTMETFCYPIAGCVSYKGFFKKQDAEFFANNMRESGFDVYMGGVAAYSTLGWFSDPLLNTFILRSDERLASLIFHELAHKILYLAGDTTFNESFATAVERHSVKLWLASKNRQEEYDVYLADQAQRHAVVDLILETRRHLDSLYGESISVEQKRADKAQYITELRQAYAGLKQSWRGQENAITAKNSEPAVYEYWMESGINNAKIGAVGAYQDWVPAFTQLLEQSASFEGFIEKSIELSELREPERKTALGRLASAP